MTGSLAIIADQSSTLRKASGVATVGVIGAGVMGRGIAQALAENDLRAVLVDLDDNTLAFAAAEIRSQLRARAVMGALSGRRPGDVLAQVTFTTDYATLSAAEYVIENVVETWEAKQAAYARLSACCGSDVILAANTSTFPISEIAALVPNQGKVIGIHFMNPAPTKMLVEVIAGEHTFSTTVEETLQFLKRIGKTGVVVGDAPGFVSNRILMLTINEAIGIVQRGTASAEAVDQIFEGCFGHAMGPLATADLIGLDTILLSLESLKARLDDPKFEPVALLRAMVAQGKLGRKSGCGFFAYGA